MSKAPEIPPTPVGLPVIYFNGWSLGMGPMDISVILQLDKKIIMELKMSYPVATNLSAGLADAVSKFEQHSGQKVVGASELNKIISDSIIGSEKSTLIS